MLCVLVSGLRGYVPDGLTEQQWSKIKDAEKASAKDYGKVGISAGFKSRSLEDFLKLKEEGKADYNMPVFNAKKLLEQGKIKESDIPYMQRKNGKPDDSDLSVMERFFKLFS